MGKILDPGFALHTSDLVRALPESRLRSRCGDHKGHSRKAKPLVNIMPVGQM